VCCEREFGARSLNQSGATIASVYNGRDDEPERSNHGRPRRMGFTSATESVLHGNADASWRGPRLWLRETWRALAAEVIRKSND
jgi:hypothetical protein